VLLITYVILILNSISHPSLGNRTPFKLARGMLPEISPLLQFPFYTPVEFESTGSWPSQVRSGTGRFVGVAENQGPLMTFLVLTDDTMMAIPRSNVRLRSGLDFRQMPSFSEPGGENVDVADDAIEVASNVHRDDRPVPAHFFEANEANAILMDQVSKKKFPMFSPEELIGRTFIREMEDGQKLRAEIKKELLLRDTKNQCDIRKFLVTIGDDVIDELIGYNELLDLVEHQMDEQIQADPETLHPYTRIVGHEGPLKPHVPTYKNLMWNVLVEWTDGTTMSEPMWLYGLRTSGARWHEHFADTLRDMGFTPCVAEPDVWMRDCGTLCGVCG
jgi:hypothetical protein